MQIRRSAWPLFSFFLFFFPLKQQRTLRLTEGQQQDEAKAKHSAVPRCSSNPTLDYFDPLSSFKDLKAMHRTSPYYGGSQCICPDGTT